MKIFFPSHLIQWKKPLYYIQFIFQECFKLELEKALPYPININYEHIFKKFSCFHWYCFLLHLRNDLTCTSFSFSLAVKVKLSKKRTAFEDQEYNIECQVEFITQGSLLPYETQSMIQQWLLINEKCIERMSPTHRPMVYLLVGNIEEGIILVKQVYRWQRKDSQLTLATQKWRQHKCL